MQALSDFRIDLMKYYRIEFGTERPDFRKRFKLCAGNFGFHCVAVYRLGRFVRSQLRKGRASALPLCVVYEILAFAMRFFHHVDVFAASIGPGFYIGHVGTIYIGRCRVGANFSVTHNVTVGMGGTGAVHGIPAVGDDVWIGSGSVLFGRIHVGSGVTVNCGSVLSRSVPDRCLVGGNPARVILRNHDNAALFGHQAAAGAFGGDSADAGTRADLPGLGAVKVVDAPPEAGEPAPVPLSPVPAAVKATLMGA